MVSIEEITDLPRLAQIEGEWRELWERDPAATPFQSPCWLLPWTRWIWGGGRLLTIAVRSGGRLEGLAPLFLWGVDRVHVSLLGAGISDYLGILAAPEFAKPVAAAIFERLSAMDWDVCEFSDLPPDSPLLRVKPSGALEVREVPDATCPEIVLPRTLDELLQRLNPKFRRNLRTAEKRLRRYGSIEFVRAGARDLEKWMRLLFRLHAARWEERHVRGMFAEDRVQRFHLEAAQRFQAAGQLRLTGLESDGVPIAVQYNIRAKDREYYYLSGFDPAYAAASPGALLLREAIGASIAEGRSAIDFLRNAEAYKYDWGARERYIGRLQILRSAHTEQVA